MDIIRVRGDKNQFILAVFKVKDLKHLIAVASGANMQANGANGNARFVLTQEDFTIFAGYNQDEAFRRITIETTAYISETEPEKWGFQSLSGAFHAIQLIEMINESVCNVDFLRNQGDEFSIGFSLDENNRYATVIDQKYNCDKYISYEIGEAIDEPPSWAEYDNAIELSANQLFNLLYKISNEYDINFNHAILINEEGVATLTYGLGEEQRTCRFNSHIEEFFDLPLTPQKLEQLEMSLTNERGSVYLVELLNERIIGNNDFYHQLGIPQEVIDIAQNNQQEDDIIENRIVRFLVNFKLFRDTLNTTCVPSDANVHDRAKFFIDEQDILAVISEVRGVQRGGGTPLLENITFPQVILAYIKAFDSKLRTFKLKKTDYLIIDLCHKENDYYVLLNDSLLTRRNEQRVDVELMDNRDLLREDHNSIHCPGNDSNAKKQMFKGGAGQQLGLLGTPDNENVVPDGPDRPDKK